MNISLPESLKTFIDEQVSEGGYGTSSEYVRTLVRQERGRAHLRKLLLDGANSGPPVPIDATYFESLRARVRDRSAE